MSRPAGHKAANGHRLGFLLLLGALGAVLALFAAACGGGSDGSSSTSSGAQLPTRGVDGSWTESETAVTVYASPT